jgi:threonine synthase
MHYFSTNRRSPSADFREATLLGQPDDKGLFFPESIPQLSPEFLASFREMPNEEIVFEVIKPYVGAAIDVDSLRRICRETVDFDFPLVNITDRISTLELFHGRHSHSKTSARDS